MSAKPLEHFCEVITKGTTPKTVGIDFSDGGIPFIKIENLESGRVVLDSSTRYLSEEADATLSRSKIFPGDVLISIAGTVGKVAVVTSETPRLNCNQAIAIIRPKKSLDTNFLKHWIESPVAVKQISAAKVTATISNLSLSQIGGLLIELPSLEEQKRIAAILDKADSLRRKRREALALADDFLRAVFLDMFGDPVTNPKGWPVKKLAEVGSLDRGVSKHRPRNDPTLLGGKHPLIQTGEVANCNGYIRSYTATYSDKGLMQSKLWPAGTLCITIAANIAKTGILQFDACFPDSVVGFSAKSEETVEYVRFWLSFLQKNLEENAPESAQKNINLAILRDLTIPVPPQDLLNRFVKILISTEKAKLKQATGMEELELMTKALQNKFFA